METLRRETLFQLGFAALGLGVVAIAYDGSAPLAFAVFAAVAALVWRALPLHPHGRFGPGNTVTTLRAAIAAGLAGLLLAQEIPAPQAALAAAAALALDGVDGPLARRTGLSSAFGARFDMEVDALTVLVLTALVAVSGQAGPWILWAGLLRYLWVGAAAFYPPLARPLLPSRRRRFLCAAAIAGLVLSLTVPAWLSSPLCAAALLSLIYSFGCDLLSAVRARRGSQD
jgi:phosphatidylglycerophosphate synthase